MISLLLVDSFCLFFLAQPTLLWSERCSICVVNNALINNESKMLMIMTFNKCLEFEPNYWHCGSRRHSFTKRIPKICVFKVWFWLSGFLCNSSCLHTIACVLSMERLNSDFSGNDCQVAWPSQAIRLECLLLPPFFLMDVCQAAINQAFILGIKVAFRIHFHALMLWKVEWRRSADRGPLIWMRS